MSIFDGLQEFNVVFFLIKLSQLVGINRIVNYLYSLPIKVNILLTYIQENKFELEIFISPEEVRVGETFLDSLDLAQIISLPNFIYIYIMVKNYIIN